MCIRDRVVEPAAKVIEQTPKAEPVVEKVVERKETPQPEKETPKPVVVGIRLLSPSIKPNYNIIWYRIEQLLISC